MLVLRAEILFTDKRGGYTGEDVSVYLWYVCGSVCVRVCVRCVCCVLCVCVCVVHEGERMSLYIQVSHLM